MDAKSMLFIILFSFLLLFCNFEVQAQDPTLPHAQLLRGCDNSENYTSNSQFQTNLNLLLRSLRSNGAQDGFFNTSTGNGSDTVYGLVQCRGDLSREDCQTCLNNISVEITQRCPRRKEATLRYSYCLLRYSNQRFFSQVDHTGLWTWNTGNVSDADTSHFNLRLADLMKNLSSIAASRPNRYESGSTNYTIFNTIYGMVQCNRDLSPAGCRSCLQSMISWIPRCCDGREGLQIFSTTCYFRYESYPFLEALPVSPPPSVTTSPPQTTDNTTRAERGDGTGKKKSAKVVAIVVPIVSSVLLLAICALIIISRRTRKNRGKTKLKNIFGEDSITREDFLQFDLDTIRAATHDFSDANKLGHGGFGAVYKGELFDGQEIAVKRLSMNSGQGSQEFKNEVILLHKLPHRNLVRLLGFCLGEEEKLLIYEFVTNTSLDKYIFDSTKKLLLDWERRYKIIEGIARGLLYLHEDSRLRIIHRDLKSGNILLDEEMNAKIADFGMAKLFDVDQTQGSTKRIVGTYGYMAPEYAMHGQFSVKSDVFSFGVLILEIVSGNRNNALVESERAEDLLSYAWRRWQEGTPLGLLDPTLRERHSESEVMRCIHIALLCVQEDRAKRPTMASVVIALNSFSVTLTLPSSIASFYSTTEKNIDTVLEGSASNTTDSSSAIHSQNDASITELEPR